LFSWALLCFAWLCYALLRLPCFAGLSLARLSFAGLCWAWPALLCSD
jgi:hypothetical protein